MKRLPRFKMTPYSSSVPGFCCVAVAGEKRWVMVSGCTEDKTIWLLSRMMMDRVRRPSVTSMSRLFLLASSLTFFMGEEWGLTAEIIRLATKKFPKPTFIILPSMTLSPYSIFWTCSRIFSSSFFKPTMRWAVSALLIFDAMVLTSRKNSWIKKSNLLPTGSASFKKL